MNKLNLGSGYRKLDGYVNIDNDPKTDPDLLLDITNVEQWQQIEESSIDEILAEHILEHIEGNQNYLNLWKEIYRVCCNEALVKIEVPHWQHESFYHDPTHCRPVTIIGLAMMDQKRNIEDLQNNGRETKLGLSLGIDFEPIGVNYQFEQTSGEAISAQFILKCIKPARFVN